MQKGNYTIELSDGKKIPIRFTTWGFRKLCEEKKISVDEFDEIIKQSQFSTEHMVRLMLFAAEWVACSEKRKCEYDEFDVWNWIDDLGGRNSPPLIEMGKLMLAVYWGIEVSQVEALFKIAEEMKEEDRKEETKPDEEKKSPQSLNGGRYIRTPVKQD